MTPDAAQDRIGTLATELSNAYEHYNRVFGVPPDGSMAGWLAFAVMLRADPVATPEPDYLAIARGCHDYGGGYGDPKEAEIFHHGIQTVIQTLEAARSNPNTLQAKVLREIGRKQAAGTKEWGIRAKVNGRVSECDSEEQAREWLQKFPHWHIVSRIAATPWVEVK